MNEEHMTAQEKVGDAAIAQFAPALDDVGRERLIGTIDVGQRVGGFLMSDVADEGTWVDTGSDGISYDCHVTMEGREYHVSVWAGSSDAEDAAEDKTREEEASQWDLLCPRVIAALKAADPVLAAEFESYVGPVNKTDTSDGSADSQAEAAS